MDAPDITRRDAGASQPLIRLQGVSRIFQADDVETHALAQVDLHVGRGEFVSISGPSGCGKSTLMSILGILDNASSGHYFLNGAEINGLGERERARIRNTEVGFIFQAFNLIGDLTVIENVELPLTFRDSMHRKQRREQSLEALDKVGMAHRLNHFPAQLSGGQQQRIAVARALVGRPAILLADEPTGNLDSRNGEAVMMLLKELHLAGSTICMVTHDTRYSEWADRKVFMFDGRIVDELPPVEPAVARLPASTPARS